MIRPACLRCWAARPASPSSDGPHTARRSVAAAAPVVAAHFVRAPARRRQDRGGDAARRAAAAPPAHQHAAVAGRRDGEPAGRSSPSSASSARSTISAIRLHRSVLADLVLVPPGFKSLQLHAEVPAAMTDIVATNPAGRRHRARSGSASCRSAMPACRPPRRLAWYAIDVERPAIDVPGLKENLYKLRDVRRILFDREFAALLRRSRRGRGARRGGAGAGPARQCASCCARCSSSARSRSGRTS